MSKDISNTDFLRHATGQAVIFESPDSEELLRTAKSLIAARYDCADKAFGYSPDIIEFDCSVAKDQAEALRALCAGAHVYPYEMDFKAYILKSAHDLSVVSQNILLKPLEEPPVYALFILLVNNVDALLTTVRSRCSVYRLRGGGSLYGEEAIRQSELLLSALQSGGTHVQGKTALQREFDAGAVIYGWTKFKKKEFTELLECIIILLHGELIGKRISGLSDEQIFLAIDAIREMIIAQESNISITACCARLMTVF